MQVQTSEETLPKDCIEFTQGLHRIHTITSLKIRQKKKAKLLQDNFMHTSC
jgi:hypothetical protein